MLEEAGAQVSVARDGKEAVEQFEHSQPGEADVILMDIMMPVMDGLEAARIIRSMDREDAKQIPIIAMTANAFSEDRRQSKEAGMNEHLSKPVDGKKLFTTVAKYKKGSLKK